MHKPYVDKLESFALQLRNEALEEAASIIRDWNTSWYNEDMKLEAQRHDREMRIRALKTDALAAVEEGEKA